ncbi:611bb050-2d2e-4a22-ad9b-d0a8d01531fe [Thermothielavioides terrestris]|uniref:Zinc transporter n=1 Tax=Thermothielavioides terrestris TaxID=2587410 RepID=A0A3S4B4Z0_9PEZI|nr:611bb050-2d2e-4a22-ad9b-d0a8d01531fe [Thermothielavioides terrestris]
MAPSLHHTEPPGTPPRTAIGEPAFRFSVICDDDDQDQAGGGQDGRDNHDDDTESLLSTPAFLHPHHATSPRPPTPERTPAMATEDRLASGGVSASPPKNPFNFQTQFISTAPVKSSIGQRRGHRYKHSSISAQHQIFQEPPPRPPPVLPASLPIPTLKEAWASMQREQRARLWWCCCHAAVAMYVFFAAEGSLAMTALSHLVFFDVGSAAVCVAVDVLGNFEVWRRSSIRHPFGLQRAEVLAGFAMSVFLVFGGFDLISHNLKHFLETVGEHVPHHPTAASTSAAAAHAGHAHHARYVSPGTVDVASLAAVVSTLVSAYGLRNHGRIRRVMRVPFPYLASLLPGAGLLANPFHFLTLCFSFLLLLLPLVSVPLFLWLDRLICAAIAASMFVLGTRLAVAQGLMLLMSYSGGGLPSSSSSAATAASQDPRISHSEKKKLHNTTTTNTNNTNHTISSVLREIESDPQVARVEEAQFWQVHYGLAMANLKVVVNRHHHHHPSSSSSSTGHGGGGTNGTGNGAGAGAGGGMDDDGGAAGPAAQLSQLRGRLARVVQNRLGEGGYGRGGSLRWEVTVQFCSDG